MAFIGLEELALISEANQGYALWLIFFFSYIEMIEVPTDFVDLLSYTFDW